MRTVGSVFVIFFLSVVSCLAQGEKIDYLRFGISVPADWTIIQNESNNQHLVAEKIYTKKENANFTAAYVPVMAEQLWNLQEEEAARKFMDNEESIMRANSEVYKLTDVVKGAKELNGRKFYTMTYRSSVRDYVTDGFLYIYVPASVKKKELFVFVFTVGHLKKKEPPISLVELEKILTTLEIKE